MQKFNLDNVWSSPFLLGVASLTLSALTLISLIMISWSTIFPEHTTAKSENSIQPFEIPGKDFIPIIFGNGGYQGDSATITELSSGEAVISTMVNFSADRYPFVEWKASGLSSGLQVLLFWRIQENPVKLHNAELHFLKDGNHFFDAAKNPEWRGTITELSIGIFGELRNQSFVFESLILKPFSFELAIKAITSQWVSSNIWKASSVNFSGGAISAKHFPIGLFFGMIFLLAVIFLEILIRFFGYGDNAKAATPRTKAYLTVIFFCCIGLDLTRMIFRFEQTLETHQLLSGKTLSERAAANPLRCHIMSNYMHKGYNRVEIDEYPYVTDETYGFDCSQDAPLPNF